MGAAVSVTAVLVGPGGVRSVSGTPCAAAALAGIDDEFVITDDGPAAVSVLWRSVFESLLDGSASVLVCPSWWSERRIATVSRAARAVVADVAVIRRAAALASASGERAAAVLEIAESFVALTPPPAQRPARVVSRDDDLAAVADQVASLITGRGLVVVDCPDGIGGASELSGLITDRLRVRRIRVTAVDDPQLLRAVESQSTLDDTPRLRSKHVASPRHARTVAAGLAAAGVLAVVVINAAGPRTSTPPWTLLVEGKVVVEVPATWRAVRVTAGPGSARLQVTSPTDAHAAVHVTQSPVAQDETLQRTADALREAMLHEPPGVFVDFNGDDRHGARPAVTYREIRGGHDIRWTVLLDGGVRISIGCQSARGSEESVRNACERAVASAHQIDEMAGTVAAQQRSNTT
jgi:type VII secretion-associated protein (TIGR03931 family)